MNTTAVGTGHSSKSPVSDVPGLRPVEIFGIVASSIVIIASVVGIIGCCYDPKKRCKKLCRKCCNKDQTDSPPLNASSNGQAESHPLNEDIKVNVPEDVDVPDTESKPSGFLPQFDIAILYSDSDKKAVSSFKNKLTSKIKLNTGESPRIYTVYDDMPYGASMFHDLEQTVKRSTYLYLFLTKRFIVDSWARLQQDTALMASLTDPAKRWSVVPVHTEDPGEDLIYQTPLTLKSIKGIYISDLDDDAEVKKIKRSLDDNLYRRVKRETEQKSTSNPSLHVSTMQDETRGETERDELLTGLHTLPDEGQARALPDEAQNRDVQGAQDQRCTVEDETQRQSEQQVQQERHTREDDVNIVRDEQESRIDARSTAAEASIDENNVNGRHVDSESLADGPDDVNESTPMISRNAENERAAGKAMTGAHRSKLKNNLVGLTRDLVIDAEFLAHLEQDDVLTNNMVEEINVKGTPTAKASYLLSIVPRRGDDAFASFCTALRETAQEHLADLLEKD